MTDKRIKMECPFCHCPANRIEIIKIAEKPPVYFIGCPDCGATFRGTMNKQEAINKWNRR